jgi:hypothetical protein
MKFKVGDIFSIPVSSDENGFGQIVNIPDRNTLIIALFNIKKEKNIQVDLEEIINSEIVFLGYSLDAKLYHKHWLIIGNNTSNIDRVKLPYNKLGTSPDIYIVNYKGEKLRVANTQEFEQLLYQTVIAPVRYENALKAHFKFQEWKEEYDKIRYENVLNSNDIAIGNKLKL